MRRPQVWAGIDVEPASEGHNDIRPQAQPARRNPRGCHRHPRRLTRLGKLQPRPADILRRWARAATRSTGGTRQPSIRAA